MAATCIKVDDRYLSIHRLLSLEAAFSTLYFAGRPLQDDEPSMNCS
jgi:hypothetical protein